MDVSIIKHYADEGKTRQQIADAVGLSYNRVTEICRKNDIKPVRQKRIVVNKKEPNPRTIKIIDLRNQGLLHKDIAKLLGCSINSVKNACKRYKVHKPFDSMKEKRIANIVSIAGYEYIGGFVNTHSKISVKCRLCGGTFERQYANLRKQAEGKYPNEMRCPYCWRKGIEEYRQKKREPKEREAQEKAKRRAEQLSRKVNDQLTKRLAIHVCKNCGCEFSIASTDYNSDLYCSKQCQLRWHNRVKNEKRIDKLKERPHDTDITLEKLFKRDGGVCYICGRLCDWMDIVNQDGTLIAGDNYPSIDHVKPVSKGGTHTWSNIKLACRACNTRKGWK
ncbi:MAG: HNH endonuclease [Oscillospiraceae bacterium]|nr:HNH endonuclease [Oscillospiraceae bacterium]